MHQRHGKAVWTLCWQVNSNENFRNAAKFLVGLQLTESSEISSGITEPCASNGLATKWTSGTQVPPWKLLQYWRPGHRYLGRVPVRVGANFDMNHADSFDHTANFLLMIKSI